MDKRHPHTQTTTTTTGGRMEATVMGGSVGINVNNVTVDRAYVLHCRHDAVGKW